MPPVSILVIKISSKMSRHLDFIHIPKSEYSSVHLFVTDKF